MTNSWLSEERNTWTNFFDNYNLNGDTISISNYYNYSPTQSIYVSADSLKRYYLLSSSTNTYLNVYPPTPPEPSGDTPIEPSGDIPVVPSGDSGGGSVIDYTNQLNNINSSINNVNNSVQDVKNQISGDTQKITNSIDNINNTLTESAENTINDTVITSGDIANTVDFSPINNSQEYTAISNLWYELLINFSNALTNTNRSINIEFRGQIYTINLDDFTLNVPTSLKVFLASFTTAFVVIYISKNIKHIIEDIQTASIDNVANNLTEDFETNLF